MPRLVSKLGWLYTKLVASHSSLPRDLIQKHSSGLDEERDEASPLICEETKTELESRVEQLQAMSACFFTWANLLRVILFRELHLQLQLIKLQSLLVQASREPRLKGPFPVTLYKSILSSLQAVLDRLHSMRCVTTHPEWYKVG